MKKTKSVRYRRGSRAVTVKPPDYAPTHCQACNRKYSGRRLQTHHWRYQWTLGDVKRNPILALDNSASFCVVHHMAADSIRKITEEILSGRLTAAHLQNIMDTMPDDMREALLNTIESLK